MEHDGPSVSVFDEHSDEGHPDEDVVGVVVLGVRAGTVRGSANENSFTLTEECGLN